MLLKVFVDLLVQGLESVCTLLVLSRFLLKDSADHMEKKSIHASTGLAAKEFRILTYSLRSGILDTIYGKPSSFTTFFFIISFYGCVYEWRWRGLSLYGAQHYLHQFFIDSPDTLL